MWSFFVPWASNLTPYTRKTFLVAFSRIPLPVHNSSQPQVLLTFLASFQQNNNNRIVLLLLYKHISMHLRHSICKWIQLSIHVQVLRQWHSPHRATVSPCHKYPEPPSTPLSWSFPASWRRAASHRSPAGPWRSSIWRYSSSHCKTHQRHTVF